MLFHARLRGGRIATRDRIDDLEVRGSGPFLKGTELDAKRHEPIDLREAALDQFLRECVAGRGSDGHVKPALAASASR